MTDPLSIDCLRLRDRAEPIILTPWLKEPGGSMAHSQGLSNNPYLFKVHSNIVLPKGIFPVGLPVKTLKVLLPSSTLATCPANLNLLNLITLTIM